MDCTPENSTARPASAEFDEIFARLLAATGSKSESDLAKVLGLHQTAINSARKRKQVPPHWVVKIASEFSTSADWLFFGTPQQCHRNTDPSVVMVKKVVARLSAGNGSLESSGEVEDYYAFKEEWLLRRGSPSNMVLMDVYGDSMEPEIKDGDTVLIDESKKEVVAGRIYAVAIDDEILVKFIDKRPGMILLRSKNPTYDPIEIDLGREDVRVAIVGRVVWWCREAR